MPNFAALRADFARGAKRLGPRDGEGEGPLVGEQTALTAFREHINARAGGGLPTVLSSGFGNRCSFQSGRRTWLGSAGWIVESAVAEHGAEQLKQAVSKAA